ncbi:MAG: choice-of-anchor D domain-containing protein, partial [Opitutaceae bacterium]
MNPDSHVHAPPAFGVSRYALLAVLLCWFATAVPALAASNYSQNFDANSTGWGTVSGTWTRSGGTYNSSNTPSPGALTTYNNDTWTSDYTYTVSVLSTFANSGNKVGLVYNYVDSSNYGEVMFSPGADATLKKVVGGVTTTVTSTYRPAQGVFFSVQVVRSGSNTTVKVDGVTLTAFNNIAQTGLPTGRIGLKAISNPGQFDNVVVTLTGLPEVNVTGNSATIADGDTTPTTADHTDFGSADIGGATLTRTYTVQNTGSGTLTLSGSPIVTLSGTNAADFAVITQPAASIAAGGNTTFQVRFDPGATGLRTASLSFGHNDTTGNENPYNFSIQGTGTSAPEVNVTGNGIAIASGDTSPQTADGTDFGSADITSGTINKVFNIQNTGSATL